MVRLDILLTDRYNYSRSQIKKIIKLGKVEVNGEIVTRAGFSVDENDIIRILEIKDSLDINHLNDALPILDIIYEDNNLLVLNKQGGVVVHHGASNQGNTLIDAIKEKYPNIENVGGNYRCGLVHRLDKDTSGVILIAKNDETFNELILQFKNHKVKKTYYALVTGIVKESDIIKTKIGRNPKNRLKQAVVKEGRDSETKIEPEEYFDNKTLVKASPQTGRMHQIRVHLKYINHPVIGDMIYGIDKESDAMYLHAYNIKFSLKDNIFNFTAPFPLIWKKYLGHDFETKKVS